MLLTRKSSGTAAPQSRLARSLSGALARTMDRRAFLKRSGVAVGTGAFAAQLPFNMIGKAEAQEKKVAEGKIEVKRTVCTHCSVGCAIDAVVQNGVWVRQEPVFDSPINLGAHCAKGASVREHGVTEDSHRLKYPMKLVNGKYQRISWDVALDEISQEDAEAARRIRSRLGLHRRFVEAQQRAGGAALQVGSPLGLEQHRPPGAHLPLDHRRRRRQHLGLRRDDELVQRRAELESASSSSARTPPRRTRCRCSTRCTRRRTARR